MARSAVSPYPSDMSTGRTGSNVPAGAILKMARRAAATGLAKVVRAAGHELKTVKNSGRDATAKSTRGWVKVDSKSGRFVKSAKSSSGAVKRAPRGRKPPYAETKTTASTPEPVAYSAPKFAGLFRDSPDLSERVKDIARGRERGSA